MSIPNFINKIKGKTEEDAHTLLYISLVILVGLSSFGLGRISVEGEREKEGIIIKSDTATRGEDSEGSGAEEIELSTEKKYVASKNGKMYYSLGCGGASRIKEENQVWFKTKEDAEKSGFTLSSTCK